ncbi:MULTISPECIES: NAD-dependent succinate-semialdehyde dehydrogenase [Pseudomonas]|uniref:NAD-dependent succinate-semialdehyde dehydrogenase n=1 Tax=Pseudomonas TaxID=286 RepID=UPI000C881D10|nr:MULTISPECIES: NAD-dependent succinate-semialdehyde dehydrogenase [Pseudomonas]MDR6579116.1 succinate-semialdehyde dehydrogenase/glutarate-semialdehyde dehydrogenase [Pseudomonas extremaustralis]PMX28222.1 succinate-semialdehyde dehydrogenase (NADP(+)) [Pseudomonas sp. GW460-12]PMX36229.1 succinate-semialdehyde dehydrogenase (NADP(+)) [Pseudomonas sp. MPR-R2A4]PMX42493.1 succinate-semialdehyde dehydrogenase (NADP(+)) [Pseudomonas sp. MPR-R2A7]PMX54504.1 succinate-semialdehyde dehydrogenase (
MKHLLKDPTLWRTGAYIAGDWLTETPHGRYTLRNPVDQTVLAELPRCRETEVRHAIDAAQEAFGPWRRLTAKRRGEVLRRWYELMVEHREDIATLITLEEGKPLEEARGEVDYAASFVRWFGEEATRVRGEMIPGVKDTQRIVVLREPIGVCAAITPWNFPAAMITRKAAPALAAGCTMVVKPASQTPLTALALAELAQRAGVPAGVFSVITGNDTRDIAGELTANPLVRKLTFTGSTEVGRLLLAQAAQTVKKCSMELGGNAPFIVFDDADLDAAADGVMLAKFRNGGQSCIGANRVLVQSGIYDALAERIVERMARLKVGNGLEPGVQVGPLIDDAALRKSQALVDDALAQGARLLSGGKPHVLGGGFFQPTLLADVTHGMRIAREEIFGPVMPLLRFDRDDEAIAMANDSEFGLAAYLFSRDAARIWRNAARIESGMVGINCGLISNEVAPFGGVKQSGLGREGSHLGIDEFLEVKYLCWDGLESV